MCQNYSIRYKSRYSIHKGIKKKNKNIKVVKIFENMDLSFMDSQDFRFKFDVETAKQNSITIVLHENG